MQFCNAIKTYLYVFHRCCLRTILGISWHDHVTNEEVMRRAGMERLQDIVTTRRRKMAGHVLRLRRERPAHTMHWVPEDGRRKRGRPKKTWQSTFKEDLGRDGCQLAWSPQDRQWPRQIETSRRPTLREEQADLSVTKNSKIMTRKTIIFL